MRKSNNLSNSFLAFIAIWSVWSGWTLFQPVLGGLQLSALFLFLPVSLLLLAISFFENNEDDDDSDGAIFQAKYITFKS